jgi:hypothetical protein
MIEHNNTPITWSLEQNEGRKNIFVLPYPHDRLLAEIAEIDKILGRKHS